MPCIRSRCFRARALCLVATAAACTSYTPAPLDVDTLTADFAQRRLDDPALRRYVAAFLESEQAVWPPARLDLPHAIAIALFHRPEPRTARERLAASRAARGVANQTPNPHLALGPGLVANPGGEIPWIATLGVLFPLDLSGRRRAETDAAACEVAAAEIDVARADQTVRAEVVEAMATVAALQQLAATAEARAAVQRRAAAVVEARAVAGSADAAALAAARLDQQRLVAASATAARELTAGRAVLAAALGMPAAALLTVTLAPLPDVPAAVDDDGDAALHADAIRRRLDVAAAIWTYARREAELRVEVARQWPDLEFGPGYEYDQGLHKFSLDLGFTLPLFHGNDAAIARATANRAAAAAVVESAQAGAAAEIDDAVRQFAAQRADLDAARSLAETAAAAVAVARQRIAAGADDADAEIAARLAELDARTDRTEKEHACRLAWLQLESAVRQPIGNGLLAWRHAAPEDAR